VRSRGDRGDGRGQKAHATRGHEGERAPREAHAEKIVIREHDVDILAIVERAPPRGAG
jgi:ribosomal protein L15